MDANPGKPEPGNHLLESNGHSGVGFDSSQPSGEWVERSSAIALRVSMALKSRNLMQKELAEMLGIKPQQVSRILKGNVNLTLETISRLESALGIGLLEVVPADRIGLICGMCQGEVVTDDGSKLRVH
jgi:ribosome-binding protein aMBF1 (putative translation factor)